jgi:hypothetical protein
MDVQTVQTPQVLSGSMSKRSSPTDERKHITSLDLENIVKSVTESPQLPAELPPLPASLALAEVSEPEAEEHKQESVQEKMPLQSVNELEALESTKPNAEDSTHSSHMRSLSLVPESSTSTFDTLAAGSECSQSSQHDLMVGSSGTEVISTSIVRGFSKEQISRSRRSTTQLHQNPPPILKSYSSSRGSPPASASTEAPAPKKKPVFMLGTSEGEDSMSDSSWAQRHSMTHAAAHGGLTLQQKNRSFRDDMQNNMPEEAIEDSDSDIEDDEDWEDDPSEAGNGIPQVVVQSEDPSLFQRVPSSTNLSSRRSLITSMMHETDRAAALQNAASRSTPHIRRSRSNVAGPMIAQDHIEVASARPMAITAASTNATTQPIPLLSPKTTRRNMLNSEMTGSLRKHILWERQQRNPAAKLLRNRQFRSETRLADAAGNNGMPQDNPMRPFLGRQGANGVQQTGESSADPAARGLTRNDSSFFDNGAAEYYERGW